MKSILKHFNLCDFDAHLLLFTDEIFLPKEDVEHGELDEFEREIEEFKRYC